MISPNITSCGQHLNKLINSNVLHIKQIQINSDKTDLKSIIRSILLFISDNLLSNMFTMFVYNAGYKKCYTLSDWLSSWRFPDMCAPANKFTAGAPRRQINDKSPDLVRIYPTKIYRFLISIRKIVKLKYKYKALKHINSNHRLSLQYFK